MSKAVRLRNLIGVTMAKRARKTKKQQHQQHYDNSNVIHVGTHRKRNKHVVYPLLAPVLVVKSAYCVCYGTSVVNATSVLAAIATNKG